MGGIVVESGKFDWAQSGKFPSLTEPEPAYHGLRFYENFGDFAFTTKARAVALRDYGPTMAPMNAFLTITGIETLHVRMERHCANAQAVAEFLADDPRVAWVSYAGLETSPYRALARKYMPDGAGAVFTFGVKGGYEAGIRLVESVGLFSHLANIGDTRSLILHPASTTHRQLTDEQRLAAGAGAGRDPPVDRPGNRRGPDRRSGPGAGVGKIGALPQTPPRSGALGTILGGSGGACLSNRPLLPPIQSRDQGPALCGSSKPGSYSRPVIRRIVPVVLWPSRSVTSTTLPPQPLHQIAAHHLVDGVVRSLHQHVGPQRLGSSPAACPRRTA